MLLACVLGAVGVMELGAACSSQAITPPTQPFSSSDVIGGFARHGLRLEVFDRAASCSNGEGEACQSTGHAAAPAVELHVAERSKVFRYVVYVYRSSPDAARAIAAQAASTNATGALFRHLRRANVVVRYVADASSVAPAFRGYLVSALDMLPVLRAALADVKP